MSFAIRTICLSSSSSVSSSSSSGSSSTCTIKDAAEEEVEVEASDKGHGDDLGSDWYDAVTLNALVDSLLEEDGFIYRDD